MLQGGCGVKGDRSQSAATSTRSKTGVALMTWLRLARRSANRHIAFDSIATGTVVVLLAFTAPVAGAQGDQLIVSPDWVAAHLHDKNLVLLQVGDSSEFIQSHIPGAHPVALAQVSAGMDARMDMDHGLMLEMLPPDELRVRLEALGLSNGSRVVVYFAKDRVSAVTRVLYTLRYAGLGDRGAFLDGGLPAWIAEKRPVANGPAAQAAPGNITTRADPALIVDANWVLNHAKRPGFVLLDARMTGFFDGTEQDDGPRRGHIPGAASLPFEELYDSQLRLRSPSELQARFQQAGIQRGDTVVAYCHIGQRATAVLLAAETLGYPVRLYDGSFQEWGRRSDLPVDNPADSHTH